MTSKMKMRMQQGNEKSFVLEYEFSFILYTKIIDLKQI